MDENKNTETNNEVKDTIANLNNTEDTTASFDPQDIASNKVMAVLAYFNLLVLIPIFAAKDSKFARFHANQGLTLAIANIAINILAMVLGGITILYWILMLVSLGVWILAILGIVNAAQGKAKKLPLVGNIELLK